MMVDRYEKRNGKRLILVLGIVLLYLLQELI